MDLVEISDVIEFSKYKNQAGSSVEDRFALQSVIFHFGNHAHEGHYTSSYLFT
jgi:uncharacterized UBP type Zn finger protein